MVEHRFDPVFDRQFSRSDFGLDDRSPPSVLAPRPATSLRRIEFAI
jgi:hypothetical protein